MGGFKELSKATGVGLLNKFMVVGLKGANLVLLQDAPDLGLRYDRHTLEVSRVTQETVGAVSNMLRRQFVSWNLMDDDAADSYWGAMHASLRFAKHSRLFLVAGKSKVLPQSARFQDAPSLILKLPCSPPNILISRSGSFNFATTREM